MRKPVFGDSNQADINQSVQVKVGKGLKFWIYEGLSKSSCTNAITF